MIETRFDPNQPLRYARYGRMSSNQQNARSPDQQFAEIDRTLKRMRCPWIHCRDFRDDGVSGRYMAKRKDFTRLLEEIKTGQLNVDLILVDTLERFGRMKNLESVRRNLRTRYGVLILTADSGFADPTSAGGQALGFIEAIRSTQDSHVKAHNVLRGKRDAAKLKRWPGGPAPRGYKLEAKIVKHAHGPDETYRELVPNPEERGLILKMYGLADSKGWGGARIGKHLNAQPELVKRFGRFHADTICRILANPIYKGELVFNRVSTDVVDDRRVIRPNDEDQWVRIPGFCEPLVPEELWNRVNALRRTRSEQIKRARARNRQESGKRIQPLAGGISLKYPLTGLVRCGLCGASLRPNAGGGRSKKGRRYVYYVCPHRPSGSCANHLYLPMEWLEKVVFAAVRRRLFPAPQEKGQVPDWFPDLVAQVRAELDLRLRERQTDERPRLQKEREQIRKQLQGWAISLANSELPGPTRSIVENEMAEASMREAQISQELNALEGTLDRVDALLDPRRVLECLHRLDEVLRKGNPSATNVELARHIDRIEVTPDGKVLMYTYKLGLFEGLIEILSHPDAARNGTCSDGATEQTSQRVRPRLLSKRATGGLDFMSEEVDRARRRPEDPKRFEGMDLNWFWQDTFEAPIREAWYRRFAAEVLRVRTETGLSIAKLADHFQKSKPTIMKALKHARGESSPPGHSNAAGA